MVFLSHTDNRFEMREVPVILAPATLCFTVGLAALVLMLQRDGEVIAMAAFSFALIFALYVAFCLVRVRRFVFERGKGELVIRDRYLTTSTVTRHSFTHDAYAELVIHDNDGDSYQAVFVLPDNAI